MSPRPTSVESFRYRISSLQFPFKIRNDRFPSRTTIKGCQGEAEKEIVAVAFPFIIVRNICLFCNRDENSNPLWPIRRGGKIGLSQDYD